MYSYSVPGIREISIVRCSDLPADLMQFALLGDTVAISVPLRLTIAICGAMPTLKTEGSIVNGKRQEKTTLEFSTHTLIPENERLAFVVTGADGRKWLIGTREPNFPVISYSESTGKPSGEAAVRTYKITHIAPKSEILCLL